MPKILEYSNSSSLEENITLLSSPKDWNWNTYCLYESNRINDLIIAGDYSTPNIIQYGVFIKNVDISNLMSAICIHVKQGKQFDFSSNFAIIENISTTPNSRKKGFAKILYTHILNKHKIILSDEKIFTDKNKISKTLGIWTNFLPTIAKVNNFNMITKQKSEFKMDQSESVRFMAERI